MNGAYGMPRGFVAESCLGLVSVYLELEIPMRGILLQILWHLFLIPHQREHGCKSTSLLFRLNENLRYGYGYRP